VYYVPVRVAREAARVGVHAWVREDEACRGLKICEVAGKQGYYQEVTFLQVREDGPKLVEERLDFVYHVNVCRAHVICFGDEGGISKTMPRRSTGGRPPRSSLREVAHAG
jgi:hypothetical protein